MSDTTYSSDRHELSKIWYAALFSILMLVIRKGVDLVPGPIEKNQLIYHIFALEVFQIHFCNKSVQVNHPGEGMGFFSSWIKTHISSMLFGVSVGLLSGSNIVKTGFFGIPDQDQFYRDGTTPAQAQLERYSQVGITLAHNIGTFSYSCYIFNLVMHLDSDNSLSKWKLLLISLLLLSAFIQVYARTRAVYGNNGGYNAIASSSMCGRTRTCKSDTRSSSGTISRISSSSRTSGHILNAFYASDY